MKRPQSHIGFGDHYRFHAAVLFLVAIGSLALLQERRASRATAPRFSPDHFATAQALAAYGKLPLTFEKNDGQSNPDVKFLARGEGYSLFLTDNQAVLSLKGTTNSAATSQRLDRRPATTRSKVVHDSVIHISMAGSNPKPQMEGLDLQPGKTNYLIGHRSGWHVGVPLYGRVRYNGAYPGIDAVYYGNQQQLETDFVVAPGSDPRQIALQIEGEKQLTLNGNGDLVISSTAGDLLLRRPDAYQDINGVRREVAANFSASDRNSVRFDIGTYDPTKPLIIDPVIVYSTFLGGANVSAGLAKTSATAIAVDASGNAYITGQTDTSDFPTTSGALQTQNSNSREYAFVTKLNSTGTTLVYSTFLGGTNGNAGTGIAIDSSGDAYVAGTTTSFDFPASSSPIPPIESTYPAGNTGNTGFFAEIGPNGANLLYATFLGGNGFQDDPTGIAVDANGYVYIAGTTDSTTFPITNGNAYQTTNNAVGAPSSGADNIFLSRINPVSSQPGLSGLIYSTYLGGTASDGASAVAVDANLNAYITGFAGSSNFPVTANAFQSSQNGPQDAFIARIDTTQSGTTSLIYSSFLGGSVQFRPETGNCIAVDSNFNAYIGGSTYDSSFPVTTGAFETTFPPLNQADSTGFVAKFNTAAAQASTTLVWATYLGGDISGDQPHAIAIDSTGNVYLTGETWSDELVTGSYPASVGAPEPTGQSGHQNGYVTVLTANGTAVAFSTYYGSNSAVGSGIALDSATPPDVFIVGGTTSSKFPTTASSLQPTLKGFQDAFVAELSPAAAQGIFVTPSSLSFGNQAKGTTSATQTVTLTDATSSALGGIAITKTGSNASDFAIQSNTCPASPATLAAGGNCTIQITFTPSTLSAESATLNVAYTGTGSPQTVSLTGTGSTPPAGVTLTPASLNFGSFTEGTPSPAQAFTLVNNSGAATTITSAPSVTGTNAADFVIKSNTCPAVNATLATGTTCTITIVFTPSVASSESATLSVSDSDPSSPQTSALSGSGTAPSGAVTLSPSTIGFGNVNLNSTSPAQTATLNNTKTTALTITSIAVTGANAADFAQTNTCGTSLAANTNCTISIKFTPTLTSAESATLTVTDSDSSSPQSVALSGTGVATGPDFTISAAPAAATVSTHGTVTATVTVNSVDGFNSAVTLNCGSLPGDSMCAFTQNPLTPAANGSVSTTVTFTTSSGVFASTPPSSRGIPSMPGGIVMFGIAALGLLGMRRYAGRRAGRIACAFALLSVITLASCTGTPSTPTGTYTVKLTGTAGAATHAFGFTLTVK